MANKVEVKPLKVYRLIFWDIDDKNNKEFEEFYATQDLCEQRIKALEVEIGEEIPREDYDIDEIAVSFKVDKPR